MKFPQIIENHPELARPWADVYKSGLSYGEDMAELMANEWLLGKAHEVVALAQTKRIREVVHFEVDTSREFISRTDEGEEYITAILSDAYMDKLGLSVPEWMLQKWADKINAHSIVGDIDHEEYNQILDVATTPAQIAHMMENKRGLAKAVKAVVENGKLWIKAFIDKRYRNRIKDAKGVSIEAFIDRDAHGNIIDGDVLGFTFAVRDDPVNPRAVIVA